MTDDPPGTRANELSTLELRERSVSQRRRRLHDRIDFIRGGGAPDTSGDTLQRLLEEEREVSLERRQLHARIDELRAAAGLRPFRARPQGGPSVERPVD